MSSQFVPWYASPLSKPPIAVGYDGPFELLDRRRGRAQLRAQWRDGSRLEGWVPLERLRPAVHGPERWVEGVELPGGCLATDLRHRRAEVAAGAPLRAAPDGPAWAHFAGQQWVTVFAPQPGDEWLAVAALSGVTLDTCANSIDTWVHARDVLQLAPPEGEAAH